MAAPPQERAKPRILVVDDDHDTVDSTLLVLRFLGFDADGAYDAETALKIAGIRPPEAVLLDLAMPGVDGYALARQLRQVPGMGKVSLICVSGLGDTVHRKQAFEAGCDHHFLKPVDWQELVRVLSG